VHEGDEDGEHSDSPPIRPSPGGSQSLSPIVETPETSKPASPRPPDPQQKMSLRRKTEIQVSDVNDNYKPSSPNNNIADINLSQEIRDQIISENQSLDIDSNIDKDEHRPVTQQISRAPAFKRV